MFKKLLVKILTLFPRERMSIRRTLFIAGPVMLFSVGGFFYLTGGRYVSTENAYTHQDKVAVSAELDGPIITVAVVENEDVQQGQLLFRVDPAAFEMALNRTRAQLDLIRQDIEGRLKAAYRQKQTELALAETNVAFAEREFQRKTKLAKIHAVPQNELDQARHDRDVARRQIDIARQQIAQLLAELGGDPDLPVDEHPRFREAKAAYDQAVLELAHTEVKAPFAGVVSKVPEVGQYVKSGVAVLAIVGDDRTWIEANFKETQLTHVKPGQSVEIEVDTYPGTTWHGRVASISQATGAEFSILPPQNASGNWVKIVQRIPVRITVTNKSDSLVLRAGMSAEVEIDTEQYSHLPRFAQLLLLWMSPPDLLQEGESNPESFAMQ